MGEHIPATMCKLYLLLHSCTLCNGIDVTANVTENHPITLHIVYLCGHLLCVTAVT